MSDSIIRLHRLFQQTGLGDEIVRGNQLLRFVDWMHFQSALLTIPEELLPPVFQGMLTLAAHFDQGRLAMVQQIAPLIDRLLEEILASVKREGRDLPYVNSDALWRRLAFAALLLAQEEAGRAEPQGKQVVMMNEMVLRVAQMISAPGGLKRLEQFVTTRGFEYALDERKADPEKA